MSRKTLFSFNIFIDIIAFLSGLYFVGGLIHGLSRYMDYFIYSVQCPFTLEKDVICRSTFPKLKNLYIIPTCFGHPFGIVALTPQFLSLIFMMFLYVYGIYYVYKSQKIIYRTSDFSEAFKNTCCCKSKDDDDTDEEMTDYDEYDSEPEYVENNYKRNNNFENENP